MICRILILGVIFLGSNFRVSATESDRLLLDDLQDASRLAGDTPAEWKIKQIRRAGYQKLIGLVGQREQPVSRKDAEKLLKELREDIRRGLAWGQKNESHPLPYAPEPPIIDGTTDQLWEHALIFRGEYRIDEKKPCSSSGTWRFLYDSQKLYFLFEIQDSEIIAGAPVYEFDGVELFIMPDSRLYTYVELVFPAGEENSYTRWCRISEREGISVQEVTLETLNWKSRTTDNGYIVEGSIGFKDLPGYLLGNPPQAGHMLHLMPVRVERSRSGMEKRTPVPFLYDGHNVYGYLILTLTSAGTNPSRI
ncbi:hypothetical protein SDC9_114069 [bioreactor metagenome]|uniref:Carbohydrate-binding domain-containing protein n=1 Tax=bioreactor metagenome TaxID=1076179 RepID=A0A645BPM0_9ZZZZ